MDRVRVLIADDQRRVREGLEGALSGEHNRYTRSSRGFRWSVKLNPGERPSNSRVNCSRTQC